VSPALAEDQGLMPVSERALESRQAHKVVGEVLAHYQLANSRDAGRDVYWVECYGKSGEFESAHMVEVLHDGGYWASCGCDFFLKYWRPSTTCKHILAAVLMSRKRG
jgi:hypothetical protein